VILDLGYGDPGVAAAALRGKGFDVVGSVADGLNQWSARGRPASTDVLIRGTGGDEAPDGTLVDVGDPGAATVDGATRIPIDRFWDRSGEFTSATRVVVIAGYGVRAALAVGMLEQAGVEDITFWRTRLAGRPRVK
jgi:rhodanese-related sulfurtransferase